MQYGYIHEYWIVDYVCLYVKTGYSAYLNILQPIDWYIDGSIDKSINQSTNQLILTDVVSLKTVVS